MKKQSTARALKLSRSGGVRDLRTEVDEDGMQLVREHTVHMWLDRR